MDVVVQSRGFLCKDPRDRIFVVLGISEKTTFVADYTKSLSHTLKRLADHYLSKADLNILSHTQLSYVEQNFLNDFPPSYTPFLLVSESPHVLFGGLTLVEAPPSRLAGIFVGLLPCWMEVYLLYLAMRSVLSNLSWTRHHSMTSTLVLCEKLVPFIKPISRRFRHILITII